MIIFLMLGVSAFWVSVPGSAMRRVSGVYLVIASILPCIQNADMIFSGMFFVLSFLLHKY